MLLTLTWCHRTPADAPTRVFTIISISSEHQFDDVACADYVGGKGGARALLHQGCTVTVHDSQVVVGTEVKCRELQKQDESLLDFYRLSVVKVVWVVARVVW